ncbi:MAG: hypothetical protein P4L59_01165 [Desulfosporosinus sp.]|nr:hypothetical protein [Desulfosporosinus sp.]
MKRCTFIWQQILLALTKKYTVQASCKLRGAKILCASAYREAALYPAMGIEASLCLNLLYAKFIPFDGDKVNPASPSLGEGETVGCTYAWKVYNVSLYFLP